MDVLMTNNSDFKPSLPITRGWLNFATVVEIIAILQLYFFSESTDKFFAWTIQVPLTAAFLGAGFGAGFILVFLYRNETLWANARIAFPGVLVFTLLTLAATLIHIDKFHIVTSENPVAVFFSWVWLIIYILAPIVQALASAHHRVTGRELPVAGTKSVTDANIIVREGRIPALCYGPNGTTAHADQEWVEISDLERAAHVYARLALAYPGLA